MNRELITKLFELYKKLHTGSEMRKEGDNWLTRYDYFITQGKYGAECPYAIKAAKLFTEQDLPDIVRLIDELYKLLHKD